MEAIHIEELLRDLGCDKIKQGHNMWVNATCPFATWRHASGQDKQPSFGVSVEPGGASKYKCHSCGISGELPYLIFLAVRYIKRDFSGLLRFVQLHNAPSIEDLNSRMRSADSYWSSAKKVAGIAVAPRAMDRQISIPELQVLPESTLALMGTPPTNILEYLTSDQWLTEKVKGRDLRPKTIAAWELGWHSAAYRISIPIRDCEKNLVGISGRANPFNGEQKPKYLHSAGFRGAFYLYGEDKAVRNIRVHLCEGFFDVIYLWQCGYNAVAMHGASISPFQVEKLKKLFKEAVIVTDGDEAGYAAADKALASLGPALPTTVVQMPRGKDPDNLSEEERLELLGDPQFSAVE